MEGIECCANCKHCVAYPKNNRFRLVSASDRRKTQKEVISSVKSSLTNKYKKKYLAAGADERANIEIQLERLRVDGRRVFSSEDFSRWRKNSKKK